MLGPSFRRMPESRLLLCCDEGRIAWTPAFAGVTGKLCGRNIRERSGVVSFRHSGARRNPGF
jgi:hypothetical protein